MKWAASSRSSPANSGRAGTIPLPSVPPPRRAGRPRVLTPPRGAHSEGQRMTEPRDVFCTIDEALAELRAGRMVVLVDDEYRENEGDLVIAAEKVTPEAVNFMLRNACGLVCLAMSPALCERLHLEPMPGVGVDPSATPFTPYIDARTGISTGT